ncbi:MAG: nucleotidyl transferase AbiEii/AbiGii toxin family protein [Acidimicrobiia bacterium]
MNRKEPKDLAASIRQRLLNLARERGEDFELVLIHYAVERFLYRLSRSLIADRFVLKGAMLFSTWVEVPRRPTRDLDLLGFGDDAVVSVERSVAQIVRTEVEPDGLEFDEGSIRGEEIREGQEYAGVRVRLRASLAGARIPLQVDVAFGDVVSPEPRTVEYPTLLALAAPRLRAYPPEPVVAEKFQALVALGMANTRMKDFYDLWLLAERMRFDGPPLRQAMEATFRQRDTPVPLDPPVALTAEFHDDASKQQQWAAFLTRSDLQAPALPAVIERVRTFLLPPAASIARGESFDEIWQPAGAWGSRREISSKHD